MVEGNCFPRERIDPFTVKGRGGTKPRKGTTRGHLDSPFDQITRLEDGRFRDSNPIAPKQSISSSFRISISPLSTRKIILQNSDQSSLDLSYHDLPKIVSQYLNLHSRIDLKIIYIYIYKKTSFKSSFDVLSWKEIVHNPCQSFQIHSSPWKKARFQGRGTRLLAAISWSEVNSWNNCVTVDAFGEEIIAGRISCRGTMRLGVVDTSAENIAPRWWMAWCCNWQEERRRGTSPKDSLRLIMAFAWVAASFWRCRFHPPRIMPRHEWRPQRRRWLRPSTRTFVFQCLLIVGQTDPHTSLFVRWTWAPFPVFDPSHRFCFSFRFPFQRSGNSLPAFSSFFDLVVSPDVVKFVRIFVIDEGLIFKLTSIREQFYYSREFSLLKDWYLYLLFNFWSRG